MERVGLDGRFDASVVQPISALWNGFTYFRRGDVIVAKITPCFENGKGACLQNLPTNVGFGSTEFHVIRPSTAVTPSYLYRVTTLSEFRRLGADEMTGAAGQRRVPTEFIANFLIPLPPLPEQTAIVRFLDWAERRIRRVIRARQRRIKLLEEYKQALIHRAVTGQIDVRTGKPYPAYRDSGVEWLGQVPEHWEVLRLKYVARLRSGESITSERIEETGDYPVYGGNGIRGFTSSFTHEGEFVLIGRQGALCGNINYANGRFWASEHAVVVHPLRKCLTHWLGELLRAMNLNQYSIAAAQPGLAVERIQNLAIPFPPIDEQEQIDQYIKNQVNAFDAAIAADRRAIELLEEFRTRLIADVVTGKLDVREAAATLPDEPPDEDEAVMEDEGSGEAGDTPAGADPEAVDEEAEP
jgi:type I restriction enzyme S subunit